MAAFQGRARPQGRASAHIAVRTATAVLILLTSNTVYLPAFSRPVRSETSAEHSGSSGLVGRHPEEGEKFSQAARGQAVRA